MQPRAMSRMARVGWAASVVLALGAGWMAREVGLRPGGARAVAERGASERPQAAADAGAPAERAAEAAMAADLEAPRDVAGSDAVSGAEADALARPPAVGPGVGAGVSGRWGPRP
jgi:hypothetical protein